MQKFLIDSPLLILDNKNLFYLSNLDVFFGIGLLTNESLKIFLNENDYEIYNTQKNEKINNKINNKIKINLEIYKKEKFYKEINELECKKIGVDNIDVATFEKLKKKINKEIFISDVIEKLREIKTDEEIENIKKACKIGKEGIKVAQEYYINKKKISEKDLAAKVEYLMKKKGSEGTFEDGILLSSSERTSKIHSFPTENFIKGIMLIDVGAKFNHYFSDITRTFFDYASEEQKNIAEFVQNLELETIDYIREGMQIKEIFKFAEEKIKTKGFKFYHSLGHGIGLSVHETPEINSESEEIIKENMVFTIEPGIYIANKFGVRFEDTIVIKNGKAKIL